MQLHRSPFEGRHAVAVEVAENRRVLRYTEDAHRAIGVAESPIAGHGFNGEHMAWTLVQNFRSEPWRGYAPNPPWAFQMIESGIPRHRATEKLYPNGAAMPIASLGLFCCRNPGSIRKMAYLRSLWVKKEPPLLQGQ